MSIKKVITGSLIGAGMLASPSAFAEWTANVGATSEYVFRGISQGGSAAVQGGVDWGHDSGLYAGTWVSNVGFGAGDPNGNNGGEVDLYLGWGKDVGNGLGVDMGLLFYWYPEQDEAQNAAGEPELNTFELYGGATYGPMSLTLYYAPEANFFGLEGQPQVDGGGNPIANTDGDVEDALYAVFGLELPITQTLNFTSSLGLYSGDEIERFLASVGSSEDKYLDWSLGIAKDAGNGMSFTLQYIQSDIEYAAGDDEPQIVIGFNKSFAL